MDLLRRWICPLVDTVLRDSLGEEVRDPRLLAKLAPLQPVDDESNLRVRIENQRYKPCVQVVEWSPLVSPVQATLSDSSTTIKAIFSGDSTKQYREIAKKDVTKDTRGAVLKLNSFEIVVGYTNAQRPDVTLYIRAFEVAGCEGSGLFGNPARINSDQEVLVLARKFSAAKNGGGEDREHDHSDDDGDSDTGSLRSQAEPSEDRLRLTSTTQNPSQEYFSTQAPNASIARKQSPPILADKQQAGNPMSKTRLFSYLLSKPQTGRPSNPLSPHSSPKSLTEESPVSVRRTSRSATTPPTDHAAVQTGTDSPASVRNNAEHSVIARTANSHPKDSRQMKSPTPKIANSKELNNADISSIRRDHISRTQTPVAKCNGTDPWARLKKTRIRRRDIRVPEDQDVLLERSDSWIPPGPGHRTPQCHVPVNLLQQWNSIQGRHRRSSVATPTPTASTQPSEPSSHEKQVSEGDWPLSSPLVPPDSSAPGTPTPGTKQPIPAGNQPNPSLDNANKQRSPQQYATLIERVSVDENQETDGVESQYDDSEMETAAPHALGFISQGTEVSLDEMITSSEPQLPITNGGSFTQVKRSPKGAYKCANTKDRELDGESRITSSNDRAIMDTRISSDVVIPATYDSGGKRAQAWAPLLPEESSQISRPFTQESVLQQGILPCDDEPILGRQPVSNVDAFALSQGLTISGSSYPIPSGENATIAVGRELQPEVMPSDVRNPSPPPPQSKKERKRGRDEHKSRPQNSPRPQKRPKLSGKDKASGTIQTGRHTPHLKKTQEVFHMFTRAYPGYKGDINVFRNSCQKLHAAFDEGRMQDSRFWDDFVYREPLEYPDYQDMCMLMGEQPQPYEVYFKRHVSKVQFKQRKLTRRGIDLVVAEYNSEQSDAKHAESRYLDKKPRRPTISRKRSVSSVVRTDASPPRAGKRGTAQVKSKIVEPPVEPETTVESSQETDDFIDDEVHETASVELGDRAPSLPPSGARRRTAVRIADSDMDMDTEDEHGHHINYNTTETPPSFQQCVPESSEPKDETPKNGGKRMKLSLNGVTSPYYPPPPPPPKSSLPKPTTTTTTSPTTLTPKEPPWHHHPNTAFKVFARSYANLKLERGYKPDGTRADPLPTDKRGVIKPKPLLEAEDAQGKKVVGQLTGMGLRFRR
ncbi:hypothetical protein AJ80_06165 [Polytolypa hystricis UAMH7299]|uniref:Shelterin complex subunit TPP1/Est3 domain-containing protein n=1 Tax=Polytolypa hystricis (strain UAMH7299) TaxID=1447883 RepID=A0A2B7XXF4_POLH7|nr:hypothetical protein AJ80_06165 [Polytolypa hystricis UAMH7299]